MVDAAAATAIALVVAASTDCLRVAAAAEKAFCAAAASSSSLGGVSGTGPEIPKFSSRSRSLRSFRNFFAKSAICDFNVPGLFLWIIRCGLLISLCNSIVY